MSGLAAAALGVVYALGACLAWDLARANLRHGHHEARLAPVVVGEGDPRFGSMSLVEEPRDWTAGGWARPVTVELTRERIEERGDDGEWHVVSEWHREPPSEAEVAASRALHGYIPELDPGPEAAAPAPSPDQDPLGGESSTAGGSHSSHPATSTMGSRAALPAEPSNPAEGTTLGPRARAVLRDYEQRLGARKTALT